MEACIAEWTAQHIPLAIDIVLAFEEEMAPLRTAMRAATSREDMAASLQAMAGVLARWSAQARALGLMQEVHDQLFATLQL